MAVKWKEKYKQLMTAPASTSIQPVILYVAHNFEEIDEEINLDSGPELFSIFCRALERQSWRWLDNGPWWIQSSTKSCRIQTSPRRMETYIPSWKYTTSNDGLLIQHQKAVQAIVPGIKTML
jgi:hypothetical protein